MRLPYDQFNGEVPILANHKTPHTFAVTAQNCKLIKGDLRAYKALSREQALSLTSVQSLYQHKENSNEHWIASGDMRHYVKEVISGDQYERAYYTDGTQPYFFSNDNISGGGFDASADKYKLGIPAPTGAPTVTTTGGGATYRGYVYSFVNSYGEEGPPSPVGSDDDFNTGYVTIDSLDSAPSDRAIDKIYLYRTNASATGTAEFQFVLEATWFSASASYVVGDYVIYSDDLYKCTTNHSGAWNAGNFTQGENVDDADLLSVYPKTNYDPPPAALKGLVALSFGSLAGFTGNELYISEPYLPHAWPTDYIIPFESDIVGIAADKNLITVVTESRPFQVYGTNPSTMQKSKPGDKYPGVNIRSVIPGDKGSFFVSRQGLIFSGLNGFENLTEKLMEASDWDAYTPASLAIYYFQKKLFAFDSVGQSGFFVDFTENQHGKISLSIYAHAAHTTDSDYFYLVTDDPDAVSEDSPPENMPLAVKKWEGSDVNYLTYTWKSSLSLTDDNVNYSVAKIILDQDFYNDVLDTLDLVTLNASIFSAGLTGAIGIAGPIGAAHEIAGDEMISLGSVDISSEVNFKLYCDGELKFQKVLSSVNNVFRLPKGFVSNRTQIQISGHIPVKKVILATSPDEL